MTVSRFKWSKWLILLTFIGIAVLGALGFLAAEIAFLQQDRLAFKVANQSITLYDIAKGTVALVIVFWITSILTDVIEHRINKLQHVRSSTRTLVVKLVQIAIYFLAFLVALDVLGIDLTALTVFSGALGIGLGFGLQKITSNFVSGMILLFEKSVEQDDLIELSDGTYGFIRRTGARFTLLETFESKEIMIPNEDFITSRVINWTYSSKQGRVEIPVGISYTSDTRKALDIMLNAARAHPLCSKDPEPVCYVREFADSSVNLLLFFWVDDVTKGRYLPQSDVMLDIQETFRKQGIEIPFPQRDLHLKTPEAIKDITHAQ